MAGTIESFKLDPPSHTPTGNAEAVFGFEAKGGMDKKNRRRRWAGVSRFCGGIRRMYVYCVEFIHDMGVC